MVNDVTLVHTLLGRTRFHIQKQVNPTWLEYITRMHPEVNSATYNQYTKNILIYHEPTLSVAVLKRQIQNFCLHNQADPVKSVQLERMAPLVFSAVVFLSNLYIQNNLFYMTTKGISFWTANLTSNFTTKDVLKDGVMTFLKMKRANANTLTAASILASLYTRNPGSALIISVIQTRMPNYGIRVSVLIPFNSIEQFVLN